eukprot:267544-Chlamydomonas_euryale.AAC.1
MPSGPSNLKCAPSNGPTLPNLPQQVHYPASDMRAVSSTLDALADEFRQRMHDAGVVLPCAGPGTDGAPSRGDGAGAAGAREGMGGSSGAGGGGRGADMAVWRRALELLQE